MKRLVKHYPEFHEFCTDDAKSACRFYLLNFLTNSLDPFELSLLSDCIDDGYFVLGYRMYRSGIAFAVNIPDGLAFRQPVLDLYNKLLTLL